MQGIAIASCLLAATARNVTGAARGVTAATVTFMKGGPRVRTCNTPDSTCPRPPSSSRWICQTLISLSKERRLVLTSLRRLSKVYQLRRLVVTSAEIPSSRGATGEHWARTTPGPLLLCTIHLTSLSVSRRVHSQPARSTFRPTSYRTLVCRVLSSAF